jgi:multidrug efflux pump subunit AcrB
MGILVRNGIIMLDYAEELNNKILNLQPILPAGQCF